jgi:hypothetical protein
LAQLTKTDMMQDLAELGEHFWAGEAEIAANFFRGVTSPQDHVQWLKHQCLRELRGTGLLLRPGTRTQWFIDNVQAGLPDAETAGGRAELEYGLQQMLEEFTHYRMYADILESITGEPISMADLQSLHLPSDDRLEAIRLRLLDENPQLAGLTFGFVEGGGAGIFHAGAMLETDDPILLKVKAAGKEIYNDEVGHYEHNADGVSLAVNTEEEFAEFKAMVITVCQERLRMRAEMHGITISEERIQEITDRKITPLKPQVIA